jgi:mono/diheme cytochrome c family protein
MKRVCAILIVAAGFMLIGLAVWMVRPVVAQDDEFAPQRGAALYAEFCQACHGPQGEAVGSGPAFQAISYHADTARDVLIHGTQPDNGAAMPPYAQSEGGLLTEAQIDDLIAYLATWGSGTTPALPEPNLRAAVVTVPHTLGDPQAGAAIYATSCYGCHGDRGQGRVPPNFPPFRVEDNTLKLTSAGTGHPYMPGFSQEAGGPLSDDDLKNLDAYLASWSLDTTRETASPEGYSTLLIIMGVASILFVGYVYTSRQSSAPEA